VPEIIEIPIQVTLSGVEAEKKWKELANSCLLSDVSCFCSFWENYKLAVTELSMLISLTFSWEGNFV
jgi:hypothetical protein